MPWNVVKDVEYQGATFDFTSPDEAYTRFVKFCRSKAGQAVDPTDPDYWVYLDAIFMAGCIGWRGVEGLEFSEDAKARIPLQDRANIGGVYVARVMGIDEKKVLLDVPLTGSSPQDGASET
jgi:hypothetical protein